MIWLCNHSTIILVLLICLVHFGSFCGLQERQMAERHQKKGEFRPPVTSGAGRLRSPGILRRNLSRGEAVAGEAAQRGATPSKWVGRRWGLQGAEGTSGGWVERSWRRWSDGQKMSETSWMPWIVNHSASCQFGGSIMLTHTQVTSFKVHVYEAQVVKHQVWPNMCVQPIANCRTMIIRMMSSYSSYSAKALWYNWRSQELDQIY